MVCSIKMYHNNSAPNFPLASVPNGKTTPKSFQKHFLSQYKSLLISLLTEEEQYFEINERRWALVPLWPLEFSVLLQSDNTLYANNYITFFVEVMFNYYFGLLWYALCSLTLKMSKLLIKYKLFIVHDYITQWQVPKAITRLKTRGENSIISKIKCFVFPGLDWIIIKFG